MRLLLAALLLAAACSRPVPPGAPVSYSPADRSFTASVPAGWKVDDADGVTRKAAFFGPPDGARPFAEMMRVSLQPSKLPPLGSLSGPPVPPPATVRTGAGDGEQTLSESEFRSPHAPPQRLLTRTVTLKAAKGYWVLEHTWPADARPGAAFDALLASFKPAERAAAPKAP